MTRAIDSKQFGNVALVIGGDSPERAVSLEGGAAVTAALERLAVKHIVVDGPGTLLNTIHKGGIDRVFNLMHGPCGEDGTLQGALELLQIPVTGSGVLGSALTMDKVRSKWLWQRCGVPTPEFLVLGQDDESVASQLERWGFPVFVKPVGQGSSIGVSKVKQEAELPAAIQLARNYNRQVIIEPAIEGDEYFAGMLADRELPLIRIETANEFFDYQAKYESDETRYFCPSGLDPDLERHLQTVARQAFDIAGASGWGRVDFILDQHGQPNILEVNTTPGMTDHGLVPKAAAQLGIDFDQLVWQILETSLEKAA